MIITLGQASTANLSGAAPGEGARCFVCSRKCDKAFDPIDDKTHGSAATDHDDPHCVIEWRIGKAEQPSQSNNRQHLAMQIGESKQTWRPERHVNEVRYSYDFVDIFEPKSEHAV